MNPYRDLPDHCYWARSHAGVELVDPVVSAPFQIDRSTRIATAGSCFAQHIARHLQQHGYHYLVTEAAHPMLSDAVAQSFSFGVFTARYGNVYTPRQLHQLALRATGEMTPADDVWETAEGRFVDPFRPAIQPGGYTTIDELHRDRIVHFEAVRRMMVEADVFVFTFGLTEAWRSRVDGAVFPVAPGVAGGSFDPDEYEFVNFTVDECVSDFSAFLSVLRGVNPAVKVLMTVSPVPLIATARSDESVITATAYSKAVLRVACEQLRSAHTDCGYFPSYEVITGQHARGQYFQPDLREVTPEGVEHVMGLFMQHYTVDGGGEQVTPSGDRRDLRTEVAEGLETICDEELIIASLED